MTGRTTLADVAQAAGVDVSLVSRVLRGEDVKVRADTPDRIDKWSVFTTVQMSLTRLGARAIGLLSSTSPTDTINEVVDSPMRIVVRDSTGPVGS